MQRSQSPVIIGKVQRSEVGRVMGRRANLPLYENIIILLEEAPGNRLQHVKRHLLIKK